MTGRRPATTGACFPSTPIDERTDGEQIRRRVDRALMAFARTTGALRFREADVLGKTAGTKMNDFLSKKHIRVISRVKGDEEDVRFGGGIAGNWSTPG